MRPRRWKIVFVAAALMAGIHLLADQAERGYFARVNGTIDGIIRRCSGLSQKPIVFAGNLVFAHGKAIKTVPLPVLLRYADALKEAGCRRIDFNPGITSALDPDVAAKYEGLVRHIRQLGLQVAINPEYVWGEAPVSRFQDYQDAALKGYAELAARYKPDHFVLVHEPTTMAARMHIQTSPADWNAFIAAAARVVRRASPETRLGAGGFSNEIGFYQEFAKMPELDFLTVDIYWAGPAALPKIEQMVQIAQAAHKPLYIEETWRPHFLPQRVPEGAASESLEKYAIKGVGNAIFEPVDVRWIHAMALYAATHGMEAVTVFRTTCFFLYVSSGPDNGAGREYNEAVLRAIQQGNRTKTFQAFQEESRKLGRAE